MSEINYSTVQYYLVLILIFIYLSLFVLEKKWPLRKATRPLLPRLAINFTFTLLVYVIASLFISPLAKATVLFTFSHDFGLLSMLPFNQWVVFILGFLLMDLSFYYWHALNHKLPLLWRFHVVHHADPDLDVSTAMRFHCVEIMYSSLFRLVQLGLIGVSPLLFFCYEFFFQAHTFFQHGNIKLPFRFERLINKIIVTPRMHGIHHSNYLNETNSNYGVVFSFWDRLHQTIKLDIPQQAIIIGVPGYSKPSDNSLIRLLLMPIKAQRHYWQIKKDFHFSRKSKTSDKKVRTLCE
ncbi:TPA: sterol desaturase family protein [Legionella pneumophila]|nr:sterol desaturase family protein [Legionella pneumophila]HAT8117173.1 sterol desaturase family protein [Legionella pneumophila]HAT8130749.1 sterol desaturase family protein [Legionella pneumophila]HAT8150783.1 sterol desaturase family protein [Legionella pneumophila]HAT8154912.1 sterol desaturase family protein [Legionella pneumophila]